MHSFSASIKAHLSIRETSNFCSYAYRFEITISLFESVPYIHNKLVQKNLNTRMRKQQKE